MSALRVVVVVSFVIGSLGLSVWWSKLKIKSCGGNERASSGTDVTFGPIDKWNHTPGTNFSNGVNTPLATMLARTTLRIMNLLVILIVLMLLFGGGGFYLGGPLVGGGGFGLILLVLLVLFFTGRLGSR